MMNLLNSAKITLCSALLMSLASSGALAQDQPKEVYPGADENSPSRSQYFSWINNTNEGATEYQTLANLDFFEWLNKEYGMILDIYAFDAGIVDGKNIYGSTKSKRFYSLFPSGLDSVYNKAKSIGTRFGIWGGPDGFGDTEKSAKQRIAEFVELCEKYDWALFKFDAVCGQLRPEMEANFIELMTKCRQHSPDLILLNHRLALSEEGLKHASTFLWEGAETYIDVHSMNSTTAPHNRAGALARGLTPELKRLTEDHGVCISSCVDFWDDDLILQAFNRSLILSPELYGNPWLMSDKEFAKLARIYNIHRKYNDILVDAIELPASYGMFPIARGNQSTRFITLRNLDWEPKSFKIKLDKEVGLLSKGKVKALLLHPVEQNLGDFKYGDELEVTVDPFRSLMVMVTTDRKNDSEFLLSGAPYQVIKNVDGQPIELEVLGHSGTKTNVVLQKSAAEINGKAATGKKHTLDFGGKPYTEKYHRKLATLSPLSQIPSDADALYESTVFAADNNALEVRSLERSGDTKFPAVQGARDAFFNQKAFVNRGLWDKYLFDGDMTTGFWPSTRYGVDQRVKGGTFRLDLGELMHVDSVVFRVASDFALEPMLIDEGNFAFVSKDLKDWTRIVYLSELNMSVPVNSEIQYIKLPVQPSAIQEVEVYSAGKKLSSDKFRASNLFANSSTMVPVKAFSATVELGDEAPNSYISVAINGEHGIEGAYAALKVEGEYVGAPSRAPSYPSNPWEYVNRRSDKNYTYYFPVTPEMEGKNVEVVVMAYDKNKTDLNVEAWISAYPNPMNSIQVTL